MTMLSALFAPPRTAPWLKGYRDGIAAGELRLPRCSACGRWEWYPRESGPACAGADYVWETVGPVATVFTITRVERPLLSDVDQPYEVGLVVTVEAPRCRIAARFDTSAGPVSIGDRVRFHVIGKGDDAFVVFRLEAQP